MFKVVQNTQRLGQLFDKNPNSYSVVVQCASLVMLKYDSRKRMDLRIGVVAKYGI